MKNLKFLSSLSSISGLSANLSINLSILAILAGVSSCSINPLARNGAETQIQAQGQGQNQSQDQEQDRGQEQEPEQKTILEDPDKTSINTSNKAIYEAIKTNNQELLNKLLSAGGNISIAVEAAARANNIDLVESLLKRGARFNEAVRGAIQHKYLAKKQNQFSPKDEELLNNLLNQKNEVININLSTLAAEAACLNDKETIDMLFDKNADLKLAITTADLCGHKDLSDELLLIEKDTDYTVSYAARFEREKILWKLLERGASKEKAIQGIKARETPDLNLIKKIQSFKPQIKTQ